MGAKVRHDLNSLDAQQRRTSFFNIRLFFLLHDFLSRDLLLFSMLVAKDGDVCISILHEPGEDKFGYERPEERWLPIHTVETILLSVISMINEPNDESPANVDAAVSSFCKNVSSYYNLFSFSFPYHLINIIYLKTNLNLSSK